jgi:RES domain-containing protein
MEMQKRTWLLLIAVLCCVAACTSGDDDDDDPTGGTSGSAAGSSGGGAGANAGSSGGEAGGGSGSGGDSGGAAPVCLSKGDINTDCPQVQPQTGDCAPREQCCHRSSNILKEEMLGPDDPLELEYRVNYSVTANHPLTIGVDFLANSTTTRYENELQSTMWRFTVPRMAGEQVSGPGMAQIGVGRYNCDGTYSYYTDDAAPVRTGVTEDVTRWIAEEVPIMVDATQMNADRIKIAFADNANRGLTWTPFLDTDGTALDWELVHQGFTITDMDVSGAGRDCIGSRADGQWTAGGHFVIYTPLKENDNQVITLISQSYCALVAFGILPDGMKELSCLEEARCVPDGGMFGDGGCDWAKLPDSLCPETDPEKALFGCHLGDEMNVNMETGYPDAQTINCTQEAPTAVADPEAGSPGQCCDPMGESATLPPCNAYRLVQDFVAAAAEIIEEEKDVVQPNCLTM